MCNIKLHFSILKVKYLGGHTLNGLFSFKESIDALLEFGGISAPHSTALKVKTRLRGVNKFRQALEIA